MKARQTNTSGAGWPIHSRCFLAVAVSSFHRRPRADEFNRHIAREDFGRGFSPVFNSLRRPHRGCNFASSRGIRTIPPRVTVDCAVTTTQALNQTEAW